jgi:hypothetical protein
MGEDIASKQQVRDLLLSRQRSLEKLVAYRKAIDAAADGRGFLPEPEVLRAMCCYIAADFNIFIELSAVEPGHLFAADGGEEARRECRTRRGEG